MATKKTKISIKVRDLMPAKDVNGGRHGRGGGCRIHRIHGLNSVGMGTPFIWFNKGITVGKSHRGSIPRCDLYPFRTFSARRPTNQRTAVLSNLRVHLRARVSVFREQCLRRVRLEADFASRPLIPRGERSGLQTHIAATVGTKR